MSFGSIFARSVMSSTLTVRFGFVLAGRLSALLVAMRFGLLYVKFLCRHDLHGGPSCSFVELPHLCVLREIFHRSAAFGRPSLLHSHRHEPCARREFCSLKTQGRKEANRELDCRWYVCLHAPKSNLVPTCSQDEGLWKVLPFPYVYLYTWGAQDIIAKSS